MIVCICNAVSDHAIRRAVTNGVASFDELQWELGVGNCCGECKPTACAILKAHRNTSSQGCAPSTHPEVSALPQWAAA